jgi:hypothetical protein
MLAMWSIFCPGKQTNEESHITPAAESNSKPSKQAYISHTPRILEKLGQNWHLQIKAG